MDLAEANYIGIVASGDKIETDMYEKQVDMNFARV